MSEYILTADGQLYHADYYNEELYHYGVKGMKWGVRKAADRVTRSYANYNTSYANKYAGKAAKRKTTLGKLMALEKETAYRSKAARANKTADAKGVFSKVNEAVGEKSKKTHYNEVSKGYAKMQNVAKSRYGKAVYKQASANAKELSKYYGKISKQDLGERFVRTNLVDTEYINMPYHRLSGRTTTRGKQALDIMLTGGIAGAVMDAKYIREQNKKSSDD